MKDNKYFKAVEEVLQTKADEKAGYPPKCNDGYVAKDGKCVPVEGDAEAEHKSGDDIPSKKFKEGGQVCPKGEDWDKKAKKCVSVETDANILNPERYLKDGGLVCPKGHTWDKEAKKCIPENKEK